MCCVGEMSHESPSACACLERLTVNVKTLAPPLPSVNATSLMVRFGGALQSLIAEAEFRGGVPELNVGVVKSAELLSVSVQPSVFRSADLIALSAAVAVASEQL